MKHGYGVYKWKSGNVYKGQFVNDQREGHGIMIWSDGTKYEGNWKNGI